MNAIEAGKLPNTIPESCPLKLDDWFSFPTDRQSVAASHGPDKRSSTVLAPLRLTTQLWNPHPHALAFRTANKSHWSH